MAEGILQPSKPSSPADTVQCHIPFFILFYSNNENLLGAFV